MLIAGCGGNAPDRATPPPGPAPTGDFSGSGLIPEGRTDAAVARACAMGDVIQLTSLEGLDPSVLIGWMNDRFNAVPAQNDCVTITAAQPPTPNP